MLHFFWAKRFQECQGTRHTGFFLWVSGTEVLPFGPNKVATSKEWCWLMDNMDTLRLLPCKTVFLYGNEVSWSRPSVAQINGVIWMNLLVYGETKIGCQRPRSPGKSVRCSARSKEWQCINELNRIKRLVNLENLCVYYQRMPRTTKHFSKHQKLFGLSACQQFFYRGGAKNCPLPANLKRLWSAGL